MSSRPERTGRAKHWTRWRVRLRLQTLRRDEGHWPLLREYRTLARKDPTLPCVSDIENLYGSWTKASRDVLDPRTPEGWDLDAIYADYLAGTTQKEIAKRLGADAEQVRQVFMRAGLRKRTMKEVSALSGPLRKERHVDEARDEVVAAYEETGLLTEVVRTTSVGYHLARRVLSEAGVPYAPAQRRRVISARDATRILREASKALGGTMSAREYQDLALERVMPNGQPWPRGYAPLVHALGTRTWNQALQKVGLPVGLSTAGRPPMPVEPCLRVIRELTKRLGRPPTKQEYDAVASTRGFVLAGALTRRFELRWENVLEAAGVDVG